MSSFLHTIIFRHRKENLKKCSLRGLEKRKDCLFYTYPKDILPSLEGYILLSLEGKELTLKDKNKGLFLIDSTWRYSHTMLKVVPKIPTRSLPKKYQTAYPRRQTDCSDPERGLASIEALFIAYYILGRDTKDLLKDYYWKEEFLRKNHF